MANIKTRTKGNAHATVDSPPGASGFWTDVVKMIGAYNENKLRKMYLSMRGTGIMIVTLQFKCHGDIDWTDAILDSAITSGKRFLINGSGQDVEWRAGVKEGDYTSGLNSFGFDWEV